MQKDNVQESKLRGGSSRGVWGKNKKKKMQKKNAFNSALSHNYDYLQT